MSMTTSREGEAELFEQIFRKHYPRVLAYARRRASAEIAIEAVADAFLVAWRRLPEVPTDALPWLLGVTRRTLANQMRSERRREALSAKLEVFESPLAEVGASNTNDPEVLASLKRLPETEREAILLIAWEGLTPRQAALTLGCSSVAFRARLYRARRRLEQILTAGEASRAQVHFSTPKEESP